MVQYIINEIVDQGEITALTTAAGDTYTVRKWPDHTADIPVDIGVGILIVREENTELEESRVINLVNLGVRIVCVFFENLTSISDLAQKYCSSKVSLEGGALGDALKGDDRVQQQGDGASAPRNRQKPHNC